MSCCGRGTRTPGGGAHTVDGRATRDLGAPGSRHRGSDVSLQYTGASTLTAYGPISGRSYRFDSPGAVVPVDPRDASWLAAIPKLRVLSPGDAS